MSVTISAALVKELRDRTNAPMMDCKKALTEAGGDIEKAIEAMRIAGSTKADKKKDRITAEGIIAINKSADGKTISMVEVNCETDFVARSPEFKDYAETVAKRAAGHQADDLNTVMNMTDEGQSLEETRQQMIAKIGENISPRRLTTFRSTVNLASYLHGERIGVIVEFDGGDEQLGRDIAMHIAASNPQVVFGSDVSPELIAKEKEIFKAQAAESGKPAEIIEKMIAGRINKYLEEVSLMGQPFVKDPDMKIEALLKKHQAKVIRFVRYAVGEGIEKQSGDFVAEVMAQARA